MCARGTGGGAVSFYCGVGRSVRACQYGSIEMSCVWFTPANTVLLKCLTFGSRLSLFLRQEKRDGLREVAFLFRRGSGSPVVRSQAPYGYRTYLVYFGIVRFLAAIPTGHGERSRRRGVNTFLRKHINLAMLSAGSPLGAARPQTCAKEPLALWTLFF